MTRTASRAGSRSNSRSNSRSKSRPKKRSRPAVHQFRTFWLAVGWGLGLIVAVGLYLRWAESSTSFRIALASLTAMLFIPAIGMLICAWRAWSRPLMLVAVALSAAYVGTFVSADSVIGCRSESAADAIVIHTHNVWWPNGDPAAVAAGAVASGADVIVLQEVWPAFMAALEADPSLADYRYRTSEPSDNTTGLAIWSRHPISEATSERLVDVPLLRARIDSPHGSFMLDNIHLTAPVAGGLVSSWDAQLAALEARDATGATVLAGDFNATMDHQQFRSFVNQGWTDAHEPKGCGYDATWPTGRRTPTLLRLDHVMVTDRFDVLGLEIGPGGGSDHRSVTATVRLRTPTEG